MVAVAELGVTVTEVMVERELPPPQAVISRLSPLPIQTTALQSQCLMALLPNRLRFTLLLDTFCRQKHPKRFPESISTEKPTTEVVHGPSSHGQINEQKAAETFPAQNTPTSDESPSTAAKYWRRRDRRDS
jgi:hypothetical protein